MFENTTSPWAFSTTDFVVPGTCVSSGHAPAIADGGVSPRGPQGRDPVLRGQYLRAGLAGIPRLLTAIDRNPYRPTFGCLDRQFWHYRTAAFPSGMYQEGVLPLALAFAHPLPGNRFFGSPRIRELAEAAIRFAARSSHRDGSCDDYYPFERALGAAVFSLEACARAYQLLRLDDRELSDWLCRRAEWIADNDESGRLANHQAAAALGLLHVAEISGEKRFRTAANERLARVLSWQSDEGWFDEYGGADPGYQTVTIDCLAKIRRLTGDTALDEAIRRGVEFARWFLHPDGSYGGEYGSRGTYHFYPHGFELLAAEHSDAADLADGFLRALSTGREACFDDDRLLAHRLGHLFDAYIDWSPTRPAARPPRIQVRHFPKAGLAVRRAADVHTVISTARGGTLKHFRGEAGVITDAGLIVELADGRVAVSQMHDSGRDATFDGDARLDGGTLVVSGPLHFTRFETATPVKQALFHAGMVTVGRWCREAIRRLLQRRLITGRRPAPVRLTRRIELLPSTSDPGRPTLRVSDTIELTDSQARALRMSFGADHQTAYVAAANVYQQSVLGRWHALDSHIESLGRDRRVTVVREF